MQERGLLAPVRLRIASTLGAHLPSLITTVIILSVWTPGELTFTVILVLQQCSPDLPPVMLLNHQFLVLMLSAR